MNAKNKPVASVAKSGSSVAVPDRAAIQRLSAEDELKYHEWKMATSQALHWIEEVSAEELASTLTIVLWKAGLLVQRNNRANDAAGGLIDNWLEAENKLVRTTKQTKKVLADGRKAGTKARIAQTQSHRTMIEQMIAALFANERGWKMRLDEAVAFIQDRDECERKYKPSTIKEMIKKHKRKLKAGQ